MDTEITFKIEKGIPLPKHTARKYGLTAALRKMKVGDSLFVKHTRNSVVGCAQLALGVGNYATRTEGDGYRIWRIK